MENKDQPKLTLDPNAEYTFEDHPDELAHWEKEILEPFSHELHTKHSVSDLPSGLSLTTVSAHELIEKIKLLDLNELGPESISVPEQPHDKSKSFKKFIHRMFKRNKQLEDLPSLHATMVIENNEKTTDPQIKKWLKKHAEYNRKLDTYASINIDEGDELALTRSEDIIRAMTEVVGRFNGKALCDIDELLATADGLGEMSDDFAHELVDRGMYGIVLRRPELFPGLEYDSALLMLLRQAESMSFLHANYDLMKTFPHIDWQLFADTLVQNGDTADLISTLTQDDSIPVDFSLQQIKELMGHNPWSTLDYMEGTGKKKLKLRYSTIQIIEAFENMGYMSEALRAGIGSDLTEADIFDIATTDFRNANRLFDNAGRIDLFRSEEFLGKYIDSFEELDMSGVSFGTYSQQLQSKVFKKVEPYLTHNENIQNAINNSYGFTDLDDACHYFLIEKCDYAIKKMRSLDYAIELFNGTNASPEVINRLCEVYGEYFHDIESRRNVIDIVNSSRIARREAEESYFNTASVKLELAEPGVPLSPELIAEYFDYDHVVRKAPTLHDQAQDTSRTNDIICEKRSGSGYYTMTEHEMLSEFETRMNRAVALLDSNAELKSLRDNITFIGEKEYQEAVSSIAAYWKHMLNTDPNRHLYVHTGISDMDCIKSDMYMFDKILEHFSDEELEKYEGRLVRSEEEALHADPEHLKVILLDDWTISGSQLQCSASNFIYRNPEFEKCIEVQLIAASKERIALGLEGVNYLFKGVESEQVPIPVRSYYLAHDAELQHTPHSRGAHITGAHSSVDFGFDDLVSYSHSEAVNKHGNAAADVLYNLPLTRVLRVYRGRAYQLSNIARFKQPAPLKVNAGGNHE